MRRLLIGAATFLTLLTPIASAQASNSGWDSAFENTESPPESAIVKLINFTADWCPNCQRLNPRMNEAMSAFPANAIERIDLDLTKTKRVPETERAATYAAALDIAISHNVDYLWMWYGGFTGIAVLVSADTGEPISCLVGLLSVEDITTRYNEALQLTQSQPPGARKPAGPDCPPPLR